MTEVTYLGVVHGTLAALHRMLPRDHGTIVQVGLALAYRGIPRQAPYCAAKHAIQGFCDSLRTELLHDGSRVRVTMVQLPAMNTPQFDWSAAIARARPPPVPPIPQPEVAADAIAWAARNDRRETYVPASRPVKAIVGKKIAPGFADRYLAETGSRPPPATGEPEDSDFAGLPTSGSPWTRTATSGRTAGSAIARRAARGSCGRACTAAR